MSALDLSTAEKVDYSKSSNHRRKANTPQRRDATTAADNDEAHSVSSAVSSVKSLHDPKVERIDEDRSVDLNNSMAASLLGQRDRIAEILSMTSRLPFSAGQPTQQNKMTDALAFLQAYGQMRSSSMFNAMQGSIMPPNSTDDVAPYNTHRNSNGTKRDVNGYETNRPNRINSSLSPSEKSNTEEADPHPSQEGISQIMLPRLNGPMVAGSLMQQRLRRYLDDVQPAEAPGIPERTKKQNRWAFNVWREWARKRNMLEDSFSGPFKGVPLDVGQATETELDYWLSKFVVEIRRKDGNPYPPHTLMQIVMGIQRYLRQQAGKPSICILDRSNPTYSGFRTILDSRIKELTNNGATAMQKTHVGMMPVEIANKMKSANEVIDSQRPSEERMWTAGIIGMDTAQALLNAVFFYNHQTFAIHYVDDHWNLRAENFQFSPNVDSDGLPEYVEFTPATTSMMVATATANGITVPPNRIYKQRDRCVVKLYKKYLSLVPSVGPFYRHPVEPTIVDRSVKFSEQWVGKNRLRAMLKHLIETYKHSSLNQKPGKKFNTGMRVLAAFDKTLVPFKPTANEPAQSAVNNNSTNIEFNDEPPVKLKRTESPYCDSPKFGEESSSEQDDNNISSMLELTVPKTIKTVTIQRGDRKVTVQLG